MKLINSINMAGIVKSTISNLEKMFGMPSKIYTPKEYSTRTQFGNIEYNDEPVMSRSLLFTNYIQYVKPSPGLKSFDLKEENLECYLPADPIITTIPKRSLVVIDSAHGEEKYVITDVEALQGDAQSYILKWTLTASSIFLDTDDEKEEAENIKEETIELMEEIESPFDRVVFDEDDYNETNPLKNEETKPEEIPEETDKPKFKIDKMGV